ncbi:QCR8 [Candida pseudojiufengensis]|uniref:QCR8 n=1 Tax=Candida pseudojiufengensis TaxID=497109 RepID=UPI002224D849|nr:QCR8 [Candida pseudojiufengensis]KAI5966352.1 QCR8 [Candida pseudojiufengensis]
MAGPPHPHTYIGWWGDLGSRPQKYVTQYSISPYVAKPLKGAAYNAVFNTFRRVKNQFLYIVIPGVLVYSIFEKAETYNEYLYTKAGREELERVNV